MIKLTFSCFVETESLHQRSLHKQRKMCCQIQRWRLLLQLVSSVLQRKRLQNRYRNKRFTPILFLSFLFVTIPISFVLSWTQFSPVLLPSNSLHWILISEQADIDAGNNYSRPEKSLNSLIIAFIGLFPICLYADIADSSSSKWYNTRILYFNVSLWQRAIECSLAAVKLAVKSALTYGDPFSHLIGVKCTGMKIRKWNFSFLS